MKFIKLLLNIVIFFGLSQAIKAVTIEELQQIANEIRPADSSLEHVKQLNPAFIRCCKDASNLDIAKNQKLEECQREYLNQVVEPIKVVGLAMFNNELIKKVAMRDLNISETDFEIFKTLNIRFLKAQLVALKLMLKPYVTCVSESITDDTATAKCQEQFENELRVYRKVADNF